MNNDYVELTPENLDEVLTRIGYTFPCDVRREGKIVYFIFSNPSPHIGEMMAMGFSIVFGDIFTDEFVKTNKKIGSKFLCVYDFSKILKNSLDK